MKFRFPVVIIDEDWKSDSASGLGIRALAKALEDADMSVVGGFTYTDVSMVANQAARASAFFSGSTESSRSKMTASQSSEADLASARALMAGTLSTERRRRSG